MTDSTTSKSSAPAKIENIEQASSNFYWIYKTEDGDFNLQTTIRGILSFEQIQAHINSVLSATAHIGGIGGKAKSGGKYDSAPAATLPVPTPVDEIITRVANLPVEEPPLPTEEPSAPVEQPVQKTAGEVTFSAKRLMVAITESGKKAFKIIGEPPYHKYGVKVWDEVLVKAGIPPARCEPKEEGYDLTGYVATLGVSKEGFKKIVKLEKVS